MALIKLGFIAPRKKLITNLAVSTHIAKDELQQLFGHLDINENARPADLSIKNWVALEKNIHKR